MNLYFKNENDVDYQKINLKTIISYCFLFLLIFCITTWIFQPEVKTVVEKIPFIISEKSNEFSEDKLKSKISELKLQHPDIIYAQAILESGNFESTIFKKNHNLFGMKVPSTRPTTALGLQLNHAYYNNWEESLIDYSLWQSAFARNLNQEQYLDLLNKIYAEDGKYKDKLINLITKLKKEN